MAVLIVLRGARSVIDPNELILGPYENVDLTGSAIYIEGVGTLWRSPAGAWCTTLTVLTETGQVSGIVGLDTFEMYSWETDNG